MGEYFLSLFLSFGEKRARFLRIKTITHVLTTLEQRKDTSLEKRERGGRDTHAVEKYASSAVETRRPSAERETSPSIVGGESHLSRADCGCDLERDRGVWMDVFFDVFVVVFFERDW